MRFDTIAAHAAGPDPATLAVAPPIHLSTTFARDADYALAAPYSYVREGSPTHDLVEGAMTRLEGGEASLVFSSGMAAGTALLHSLAPGSHVVMPEDVYYGYRVAAVDFFERQGIAHTFAPLDDLGALRSALRPETRLVWLETPSNPLLRVTDLAGAITIAHEAGAAVVVDNTFATPAFQRPLDLGADVALHSTTKYLGGHSDVQGGALVFREKGELHGKAEHVRHVLGAAASPFNSWLVLRGIRTLAVRVERQASSAGTIARFLEGRDEVAAVHYPGLASHPGHEIARRQMSAFGGMLSFRMRKGRRAALAVARGTSVFVPATSLGGVESLIEHRKTSEGPSGSAPEDLVRLSVGLEHPDDLVEDLLRAIEGAR